jgi:Xaa-Pro aminopeptidase
VTAPENLFYIAGYDSIASHISPQALIFSVLSDRLPTLLVRDLDLPLVKETSWVQDVRTYHLHVDNVPEIIRGIFDEHGVNAGKVGLELGSHAVTASYALSVMRGIPNIKIEDSGFCLNKIQYIKSPAELRYVKEAAGYANLGVKAARRALRPGITELELCSAVEFAMRNAGSDYPAIPTECASGVRSPGGHAAAMPKIVGEGELVHLEFAGVSRRYHSVSMITMAAGTPSDDARRLYDVALESLLSGMEKCSPGALVADIDIASQGPIKRAGLEHAAQMRFGIGIGIGYPPIWVGSFEIDRFSKGVLVPGMVFYVHSWLGLPDKGLGAMLGGTFLVTQTGVELLSGAGPVEMYVA